MEQTTETELVSQSQETETVNVETQIVKCETLNLSVNIDVLRQFSEELGVLVDEAKIVFSVTDGLKAKVVDPAHIAMVETGIALEMLESFDYQPNAMPISENGEIAEFGLDVSKMLSYLKSLRLKDTVLKLSVDFERRKLTIDAPNGQRVMSLIDTTGMSDPKIPTLNLPVEVAINDYKAFRAMLRQASEISDHIALEYHKDGTFWLLCEGDMDKYQSQLEIEEVFVNRQIAFSPKETSEEIADFLRQMGTYQGPEPVDKVRSLFPLEYLGNMAKVIPGPFHLTIGNDYPLKIGYGRTTYLLAPRIESGD